MVNNIEEEFGAQKADLDQCRFGFGVRRPTCISVNASSLMELMSERQCNLPCELPAPAGLGQDGRFLTALG